MLDAMTLHNFKSFSDDTINIGKLTLLSGLNGTGKSTVLQALALLRQSFDANFLLDGAWLLNGDLVELGIGRDVGFSGAFDDPGDEIISIALLGQDPSLQSSVTTISAVSLAAESDVLLNAGEVGNQRWEWERFPLFEKGFQYLRADRINPAVTYPKSQHAVNERRSLGSRGEFTAHYLLEHGDDDIEGIDLRRHETEPSNRVLSQVNAWIQEFSPGVRVQVQNVPMTDFVRLEFSYRTRGAAHGQAFRPTNVGFGLTHALPIVVGCLVTPPRAMLLIENPEAQLHPQGQVMLGRLLARVAASGVQVVVETHSDHILNGIRVAIKDSILPPEDTKVHFFSRSSTGATSRVSPVIDKNGMLSDWPPGFFTQWDDTLMELLG